MKIDPILPSFYFIFCIIFIHLFFFLLTYPIFLSLPSFPSFITIIRWLGDIYGTNFYHFPSIIYILSCIWLRHFPQTKASFSSIVFWYLLPHSLAKCLMEMLYKLDNCFPSIPLSLICETISEKWTISNFQATSGT